MVMESIPGLMGASTEETSKTVRDRAMESTTMPAMRAQRKEFGKKGS